MINNVQGFIRENRWLTAHNAWNTLPPLNNQCHTITELLDNGVRGFALDIYGDTEHDLHLQHGHNNIATWTDWSKVHGELDVWLGDHPRELVFLFFESKLAGPTAPFDAGTALGGLHDSLARIPCYAGQRAATENLINTVNVGTLMNQNKRLFAFIEKEPDEGPQRIFAVMRDTFSENVYGDESLVPDTWINWRHKSGSNRPLVFMNHFGNAPSGSEWDRNDPALLTQHMTAFQDKLGGRLVNFLSLDYINWNDSNRGPIVAVEWT